MVADKMRSLVALDTETTGLSFEDDRVIEIGCIKLIDRKPVETFHVYLKTDKPISAEAVRVHGITHEMLADKPYFAEVMSDFLAFVAGSSLVIHNAAFDMGFLEAELSRAGYRAKLADICPVIDTLMLARKTYPGKKNSLDALCKRFGIDISHRAHHGALKDADLLVKVYLQLTTDQSSLRLQTAQQSMVAQESYRWSEDVLSQTATAEELASHKQWMAEVLQREE